MRRVPERVGAAEIADAGPSRAVHEGMSENRYEGVRAPGEYHDLRSRLGEPLWWDEAAVPRYDPFRPDALDGAHDEVALVEIKCGCGASWAAAMSSDETDRFYNPWSEPLSTRIEQGFLYWGSAPPGAHACGGGETVSVEVPRVLELWRKVVTPWHAPTAWLRVPALERTLPDDPDMRAVGSAKARQLAELGYAADVLLAEHRGCGTSADEKLPGCPICLLGSALRRTRDELAEALAQGRSRG